MADLSYQTQSHWDSKNVLPGAREETLGWRRFSAREVFVIMVVAEARKRLGIPLKKLAWLQAWMLKGKANLFVAAWDHMQALKSTGQRTRAVYLVTNLSTTAMLLNDGELSDGMFGGDDGASYVLIKVDPLVNKLVKSLASPRDRRAGT